MCFNLTCMPKRTFNVLTCKLINSKSTYNVYSDPNKRTGRHYLYKNEQGIFPDLKEFSVCWERKGILIPSDKALIGVITGHLGSMCQIHLTHLGSRVRFSKKNSWENKYLMLRTGDMQELNRPEHPTRCFRTWHKIGWKVQTGACANTGGRTAC